MLHLNNATLCGRCIENVVGHGSGPEEEGRFSCHGDFELRQGVGRAAVGLAGASYLSFPVAAFFAITVLIVGLSSGTIAQVVKDGTFGSTNHDTGAPEGLLGAVDFIMVPLFKAAHEVLTMVNDFSPVDALSTGRSVSWTTLLRALFQIWGLIGGVFVVFGIVAFTRRELATAQGKG